MWRSPIRGPKGKPVRLRRCSRNCKRRAEIHEPLGGDPWEGGSKALTRESGDLPSHASCPWVGSCPWRGTPFVTLVCVVTIADGPDARSLSPYWIPVFPRLARRVWRARRFVCLGQVVPGAGDRDGGFPCLLDGGAEGSTTVRPSIPQASAKLNGGFVHRSRRFFWKFGDQRSATAAVKARQKVRAPLTSSGSAASVAAANSDAPFAPSTASSDWA